MGAFVEIGRTKVSEKKSVAISRRGDGQYSMAQVVVTQGDDSRPMNVFFKGAFTMTGEGLLSIKNLIGELFDEDGNEKK